MATTPTVPQKISDIPGVIPVKPNFFTRFNDALGLPSTIQGWEDAGHSLLHPDTAPVATQGGTAHSPETLVQQLTSPKTYEDAAKSIIEPVYNTSKTAGEDILHGQAGAALGGTLGMAAQFANPEEEPEAAEAKEALSSLPKDEYVYHATDKSRAASIEQNGLRPGSWYTKTPQEAMKSGVTPISGNRADLRVYAVPKSEINSTGADILDMGARDIQSGKYIRSSKLHAPTHEVSPEGRVIRELKTPKAKTITSASGREMQVPPERTTGVHDATIKQSGAIPGGIMKKAGKMEHDLVLFHDPHTGSTLALPANQVSVENITAHLAESRAKFAAGEAKLEAIPGAIVVKTPKPE